MTNQGRSIRERATIRHTTADAAAGWLAKVGEASGWVETHRELLPWRSGDSFEGTLIRAEWACGDRSGRVTFDGATWICLELEELDAAEGSVVEHSYLSTVGDPSRARLVYRTAWVPVARGEIRVFEPGLTRFAGWRGE